MRIRTVIVLYFLGLKYLKGYTMQIYFSNVRNVKSNIDTSVDKMAKDPTSWQWTLSIHNCACLLYSPDDMILYVENLKDFIYKHIQKKTVRTNNLAKFPNTKVMHKNQIHFYKLTTKQNKTPEN